MGGWDMKESSLQGNKWEREIDGIRAEALGV